MERSDKSRILLWPFVAVPFIGSVVYTAWVFLRLLPDVQAVTDEIGGPAQAFLSTLAFPASFAIGTSLSVLVLRGLFRRALELPTAQRCLIWLLSPLLLPIILFLMLYSIVAVMTGHLAEIGNIPQALGGLARHAYPPLIVCSVLYMLIGLGCGYQREEEG